MSGKVKNPVASGNTLPGIVIMLRKSNPFKIMTSVPFASGTAVEKLSKEVDGGVAVLIAIIPECSSPKAPFMKIEPM